MTVKLIMNNATSTTTNVSIQVVGQNNHPSNCTFALMSSHPLRLNGTYTFTNFSVSTMTANFTVTVGASFTGTIDLPIAGPKDGARMSIQVNNLNADSVYVEWPSGGEQEQQELTPGTPMFLNDIDPDVVIEKKQAGA